MSDEIVEIEDTLEPQVVVYIGDDGKITDEQDVLQSIENARRENPEAFKKSNELSAQADLVSDRLARKKGFEGSNQDLSEIGDGFKLTLDDVIDPPYPPQCFAKFLESDEILSRCIATKVSDSVGREYVIEATLPIRSDVEEAPDGDSITQEQFTSDKKKIEGFIKRCNRVQGFRGVLKKACMDHEAIGWGAIEVIRAADMSIARLEHVPATRLKVLKGFKGFVEEWEEGKVIYYQFFGDKVVSKKRNENTGSKKPTPYDPELDGELNGQNAKWFLIDKETGEPMKGSGLEKAANEILYFPRLHSNTVYYGYTDTVPAVAAILTNSYIRDYLIQFFEHNTIPRYAVIIKGANVDDDMKKLITEYFSTNVKGSAHKTLILTLTNRGNKNIEIEFKALDTAQKEGDFLATRKEQDEKIQVAHGMSPAILGIVNNSELGSGKGLSQAEIYKDRIITPLQDYWEDKLNTLFSFGLGVLFARLQFNPLDIRDELMQAQIHQIYSTIGAMTINDIRRALGLGPIKGGDVPFIRIREGSAFKVEDLLNWISSAAGNPANLENTQNPANSEDNPDSEDPQEESPQD